MCLMALWILNATLLYHFSFFIFLVFFIVFFFLSFSLSVLFPRPPLSVFLPACLEPVASEEVSGKEDWIKNVQKAANMKRRRRSLRKNVRTEGRKSYKGQEYYNIEENNVITMKKRNQENNGNADDVMMNCKAKHEKKNEIYLHNFMLSVLSITFPPASYLASYLLFPFLPLFPLQ